MCAVISPKVRIGCDRVRQLDFFCFNIFSPYVISTKDSTRKTLPYNRFDIYYQERHKRTQRKPGKKIKLACVEFDLTQTQLAEKINAEQKSISRYETGASLPSIKTLVKISKVLKESAGYSLDE